MFAGLPSLSHEQQQKAVERIQELMSQGMSSGQAIAGGGRTSRHAYRRADRGAFRG
jgi:uncharacterized protein YoaH (UPF0181 family)